MVTGRHQIPTGNPRIFWPGSTIPVQSRMRWLPMTGGVKTPVANMVTSTPVELNYMPDKLVNHKWERCQSIDKNSWGYRKDMQASEVMDLSSIINNLVSVVALGGNYLLTIGPDANGKIHPLFEERLKGLGGWLKTNGEAIYGSRPWKVQKEDCKGNCKGKCTVWYTSKDDAVYAIIVGSTCTRLELTEPKRTKDTKVTLVGKCIEIKPDDKSTDLIIPLPDNSNAWCLKLEGVE
ncbi:Tissue alpha-L-fucosidase [Larimichthys crocea]|uniref:Tissue alpha-L-fucosidase n=1 Tax=Larimichthys crocea TaxID=215358 RepID=A0A6G0HSJ1_LARCR|nr:Tissue alpha-L-fucosidase [Larimichthys crocea]